jgi:dephospho-CoA kinase
MPKIILLIGSARSGKSTIAKHLTSRYGFKEYALATKLKEFLVKIFPVFNIHAKFNDLDRPGPQKEIFREYLQKIGTEGFRATFGQDFWCEQLNIDPDQNAVISDIRFVNEFEYFVKKYPKEDLISIRVERDTKETVYSRHVSEVEHLQIKPDYTVKNYASIEGLYEKIDKIMSERGC